MWRFPCEECSHISWAGAGRLLAYCKPANRPSGYYLFEEFSDSITAVGHNLLTSDGHPQVSSNGRYILLDTYPDRSRSQKLRIYDMTDHEVTELIKYRIPFKYRHERRCDFHPRWSRDESMICFDTAHTGVRSLCVIRNPVSML